MPRLPYRFAAPCAVTLLAAGAAHAQVISTQAVAPLGATDFRAGARMQFGLSPTAYQLVEEHTVAFQGGILAGQGR